MTADTAGVPETADTAETAETPIRFRPLSTMTADPTRWLIVGHLADMAVNVLVGREGIGKSLWWVWVVAHLTTGTPNRTLGYAGGDPVDVLVVSTEDSAGDVAERLRVAGADLDRVHVASESESVTATPTIGRHSRLVSDAVAGLREQGREVRLVVVDAWLDTVPGDLHVKNPQEARRALAPWRDIAEAEGVAVLLLTHTNRMSTGDPRDTYGATSVIRQKARLTLYAARSPQGTLLIGPEKGNHSAEHNATAYRVAVRQARPATAHDPGTVALLEVEGATGAPMSQHLATWHAEERRAEHPTAEDRAARWLEDFMTKHGWEVGAEEAKDAAKVAGHNPDRLARLVRDKFGGYAGPSGSGGPWVYRVESRQSQETPQSQVHGTNNGDSTMPTLALVTPCDRCGGPNPGAARWIYCRGCCPTCYEEETA